MYTVGNTTTTSATLPNLQCNTKYTVWVYARGDLNDSRSLPRMVNLPARSKFMLYSLSYSQHVYFHCTTTAPPTPTGVIAQYVNASSVRVAWQWTSSGPAPSCFNTTHVTYHPEGGGESSLQLSDPAATETTLTCLQCNTSYTITVVATAGEHRRKGVTFLSLQGIYYSYIPGSLHVFHKCFVCTGTSSSSTCQEVSGSPAARNNTVCNQLFYNIVQIILKHPVTLVLNHPVILV